MTTQVYVLFLLVMKLETEERTIFIIKRVFMVKVINILK